MKKHLSIILMMLLMLAGCSSTTTDSKQMTEAKPIVSNATMIKEYDSINNQYAKLIDSYANSLRDNKLEMQEPAQQLIKQIDKTNVKLQKNTVNKKNSDDFIKMNKELKQVALGYQNNDFTDFKTKQTNFNKAEKTLRNDLNINYSNDSLSKASKKLQQVMKNRPDVQQ